MRTTPCLVILAPLAWVCTSALAQTPIRDGPFQKLVLDGFEDTQAWGPAEATVEPDREHVRGGTSALHLGIDVNWETGEKAYPIGWPRTQRSLGERWQQDWTAYDFLHFWVYTTTSRDALPDDPLGLILYTPDKPRAYSRTLSELRKDAWVEIRIPVEAIPRPSQVTFIQFFISESNYRHGDRVDFYISDLALLRYAEPTLDTLRVGQKVMYADARYLPVHVRTFGIPPRARTPLWITVLRAGKAITRASQEVGRGEGMLWIDLGAKPAAPGECEVRARLKESTAPAKADVFRVVASPWR
jgi:hypothetical protein